MENEQKGFQNLEAWKSAHEMVLRIYGQLKNYLVSEKYNITNQLMRAAVSVATNIAEGTGRGTRKEIIQFFIIARGSLEEVKYLMILSKDLKYIDLESFSQVSNTIERTSRLVNGLIRSLKT